MGPCHPLVTAGTPGGCSWCCWATAGAGEGRNPNRLFGTGSFRAPPRPGELLTPRTPGCCTSPANHGQVTNSSFRRLCHQAKCPAHEELQHRPSACAETELPPLLEGVLQAQSWGRRAEASAGCHGAVTRSTLHFTHVRGALPEQQRVFLRRTHRRHRRAAANWLPLKAQGPGRLISRVFTPPLLIWRVRDIPGGSRTSREVTPISSRRLLIPAGGEPGAAAGSHQPELRQNNLAAIWSERFGV